LCVVAVLMWTSSPPIHGDGARETSLSPRRVVTALFTNHLSRPQPPSPLPPVPPLAVTSTALPMPTNASVLRRRRFDALQQQYNLTRSRKGKAAIKDAVNFLLDQEDNKAKGSPSRAVKYVSPNPSEKCTSEATCPVCKVTMNAILHEGSFEYLGDGATPPYDDHCWSARIRYHTAPVCQKEEDSRGVVPIYKWRWTLESAKKGYCVMPDTSPPKVAAAYYDRTPAARRGSAQRNLTILMLGLSFMGEPFMSMGCLYDKLIVGGRVSGETMEEDLKYDVLKVKENGGICSGYPRAKMASFYSPALHAGDKDGMPKQNIESCSMDHAYVVYGGGGGGGGANAPSVKVCFIYTFNSFKNVQYGQKFGTGDDLPCHIRSWNDIDVILSIPHFDEVKHWVRSTRGFEGPDLSQLQVRVLCAPGAGRQLIMFCAHALSLAAGRACRQDVRGRHVHPAAGRVQGARIRSARRTRLQGQV